MNNKFFVDNICWPLSFVFLLAASQEAFSTIGKGVYFECLPCKRPVSDEVLGDIFRVSKQKAPVRENIYKRFFEGSKQPESGNVSVYDRWCGLAYNRVSSLFYKIFDNIMSNMPYISNVALNNAPVDERKIFTLANEVKLDILHRQKAHLLKNYATCPINKKLYDVIVSLFNKKFMGNYVTVTAVKQVSCGLFDAIEVSVKNEPSIYIVVSDSVDMSESFGRYIVISASDCNLLKKNDLEAVIRHELAHILCQHGFIMSFLHRLYNEFCLFSQTYTKDAYNQDVAALTKAIEKEADIVSVFGALSACKESCCFFSRAPEYVKREFDKPIERFEDSYPSHKERYTYMSQIAYNMSKEDSSNSDARFERFKNIRRKKRNEAFRLMRVKHNSCNNSSR